ncbi:MAG: hypothetical protein ACOH2H_24620 [Cypionkella sp.]
MKTFVAVDERLRARAGAGPGIVFTGRSAGPTLVGANVVISLNRTAEGMTRVGPERDAIARACRAGRSLALGAGTLELVEDGDDSARLYVPGREPLDIFGDFPVKAFRLLVEAARRGAPGVKTAELLGMNRPGYTGAQYSDCLPSGRAGAIHA